MESLTQSSQPGELVLFLILKYQKRPLFLLLSLSRSINGHRSFGFPCNHILLYGVDAKVLVLWKTTLPGPLCNGSQLIFCSSYKHKIHVNCIT